MQIVPSGKSIGARITGIDLAAPLCAEDFATVLRALATHAVLCFPGQHLDAGQIYRLSKRFGSLQSMRASAYGDPEYPDVSVLSNIVRDGKAIGVPDAGQVWHTDMTYNSVVGYVNVLHALEVPTRDGRPLGGTEFADTATAYDDLPEAVKRRLDGMTARHDLNLYWEYIRRERGSTRAPLSEEERRARPPVDHPVFLTHPISGRKVIYVSPAYVDRIHQLSEEESEATLKMLFDQVLQPKYRFLHQWTVGDVLIWDHLLTWHQAIADYGAHEHRLIKRCQVLADRVFDPGFVAAALAA